MIIDTNTRSFQLAFSATLIGLSALCFAAAAFSWTGPTGTPPDSNVSAPVNVGATSQIKSGAFSANGILSSPGNLRVVNGSSDITIGNHGWTGINMYHGTARSYIQADATGLILDAYTGTQDKVTILGSLCLGSACKSSWTPASTYTSGSCTAGASGGTCTAVTSSCPSGYARSGCSYGGNTSGVYSNAYPYGSAACACEAYNASAYAKANYCYAYCVQ